MGFGGGGFFGSGAKQDSGNSETDSFTSANWIDMSGSEGASANVSTLGSIEAKNSNISIETTDFGALDTASDIADGAFQFSNNSLERVSETVSSAVGALRSTARDAVEVAQSATRDESARTMQFVVLGLTVAGVAFFFRGGIKKAFK